MMPFDWYRCGALPEPNARRQTERAAQAILDEARQRARLLRNLGYPRDEARRRVLGNLRWEYELAKQPKVIDQVPAVVDEVYLKRL